MGRRSRRRGAEQLAAPETPVRGRRGQRARAARRDDAGDAGASTRRCARGGLDQEDAWQRAVEFLFERLAVRWEIAGAEPIERQKELLARYRFAGGDERAWIRDVLRRHLEANFPELDAP